MNSTCGATPDDGNEVCHLPVGHKGWHRGRALVGRHGWPPNPTARRCPTCSAPAGQPCRTVTGRTMALAHRDRRR